MELNLLKSFLGGEQVSAPDKKEDITTIDQQLSLTDFNFIDQFISLLITNLNTGDLSLSPGDTDKLAAFLKKESQSNGLLSGININELMQEIKVQLANTKTHKLNLDDIYSIVKDSIYKKASNKPVMNYGSSELNNGNIAKNSELSDTEKLLMNLRKFLSDEDYNKVKDQLLGEEKSKFSLKDTHSPKDMNKLAAIISSKESEVKNKISAKGENFTLETTKDTKGTVLKENLFSEFNNKSNSNGKGKSFSNEVLDIFEKLESNSKVKLTEAKPFDALNNRAADIKKTTAKIESQVQNTFIERTLKAVKLTNQGRSQCARINLQPRSMGGLNMQINLTGNVVKLYIMADKKESADIIEKQLPLLREKLSESGLRADQVIIESSEAEENISNREQYENQNEKQELRREFLRSFKKLAEKEEFNTSLEEVMIYDLEEAT